MTIKRIFWLVLTVTLIAWTGVGIYFLTTKVPESPKRLAHQPTPSPESQPSPTKTSREPLPGSHYFPSDEEIVEGIAISSNSSQMTLDVDGQLLTFYTQGGSTWAAPDESEEEIATLIGKRVRLYYEEKNGKFYWIFGELLK